MASPPELAAHACSSHGPDKMCIHGARVETKGQQHSTCRPMQTNASTWAETHPSCTPDQAGSAAGLYRVLTALTTHWILTGLCVYPFFRQRTSCAMTALSRVLENASREHMQKHVLTAIAHSYRCSLSSTPARHAVDCSHQMRPHDPAHPRGHTRSRQLMMTR